MKYLLTCQCGAKIEVEPSQAGDFVACVCGASIEVPTLRQIRELPQAAPAGLKSSDPSGWGVRQGVLSAGLLLAAILGGISWYMWLVDPPPPADFDPQARNQAVAEGLSNLTPLEGFQRWVYDYKSLRELNELQDPRDMVLRSYLLKRRIIRAALLGAAGLVLLGSLAAYFALPRA